VNKIFGHFCNCWAAMLLIVTITFLVCIATNGDFDDEVLATQHYCENVKLWEADRIAGITANQRAGWPNYKEADCTVIGSTKY
jgi:hypothetical protein